MTNQRVNVLDIPVRSFGWSDRSAGTGVNLNVSLVQAEDSWRNY
jgi:hypothetical protein